MKRLPNGVKRLSKEEFVNKTLAIKEEKKLSFSFQERIGTEWSKINEKSQAKKSIRW